MSDVQAARQEVLTLWSNQDYITFRTQMGVVHEVLNSLRKHQHRYSVKVDKCGAAHAALQAMDQLMRQQIKREGV